MLALLLNSATGQDPVLRGESRRTLTCQHTACCSGPAALSDLATGQDLVLPSGLCKTLTLQHTASCSVLAVVWTWRRGETLLRTWPPLLLPCGRPSGRPAPCATADASSTDDWIIVRTAVSAEGQGGPGSPYRNLQLQSHAVSAAA